MLGAIPRCGQKKIAARKSLPLPRKYCLLNFAPQNFAAAVAMAKDNLKLTLTFSIHYH